MKVLTFISLLTLPLAQAVTGSISVTSSWVPSETNNATTPLQWNYDPTGPFKTQIQTFGDQWAKFCSGVWAGTPTLVDDYTITQYWVVNSDKPAWNFESSEYFVNFNSSYYGSGNDFAFDYSYSLSDSSLLVTMTSTDPYVSLSSESTALMYKVWNDFLHNGEIQQPLYVWQSETSALYDWNYNVNLTEYVIPNQVDFHYSAPNATMSSLMNATIVFNASMSLVNDTATLDQLWETFLKGQWNSTPVFTQAGSNEGRLWSFAEKNGTATEERIGQIGDNVVTWFKKTVDTVYPMDDGSTGNPVTFAEKKIDTESSDIEPNDDSDSEAISSNQVI